MERARDRADSRVAALQTDLEAARRERDQLDEQLALLERMTPIASTTPATSAMHHPVRRGQIARGAAVRDVAVRLLLASGQRTIHYTDWFRMFEASGYVVDAQEPLAAFLTQIRRSPLIRGTGGGVYRLDLDVVSRLRARAAEIRVELNRPVGSRVDAHAVADERQRRNRLARELDATERRLEEALRAIEPQSAVRSA